MVTLLANKGADNPDAKDAAPNGQFWRKNMDNALCFFFGLGLGALIAGIAIWSLAIHMETK